MPLYEYKCEACDHRFEKLVKMSAMNTVMTCPVCGEQRGEKQISGFAVGGGGGSGGGSSCGAPRGFS